MKFPFLIFCLFAGIVSNAQTVQKYYDWQWKPSKPERARFVSLQTATDSGWLRRDLFLATKKTQMTGLYKDSACKIRNGWFRYFYANGNLLSEGRYVDDERDGLWLSWHYNRMIEDSIMYEKGNILYRVSWHNNGFIADSSGYDKNGYLVQVAWFDNGVPAEAGRMLQEKKEGKWQYFNNAGGLVAVEEFKAGKRLSRIYYNDEGLQLKETASRDRDAEFKGGIKKWQAYLSSNLKWPENVELVNTSIVTVVIAATIDEEGNIKDVYVDVPFDPLFDEEAMRVVQRSPKGKASYPAACNLSAGARRISGLVHFHFRKGLQHFHWCAAELLQNSIAAVQQWRRKISRIRMVPESK
jgi:antitoxin component YwqK of YwqJK toxin-antitoxin module